VLTSTPDTSAEPEERSEIDRLIDALQPRWEVAALDTGVDVIYLDPEHGQVVAVQAKRYAGAPEKERPHHTLDHESINQAVLQALSASQKREMTLLALARAVLERLREDSVSKLAELLDKSVDELEAERGQAAQVEGDREPDDPYEILKVLPEQYHEWFLADYRRALRAAYPAEGYLALTLLLRKWRLRAEQYADPDYQRSLDEARVARVRHTRPHGWRSGEEVRERLRSQGRQA
jgi:uncharacterized protein DUF6247/Mrr restriction endonuclease-like protein